jgi:hypothetical protein
VENVSDGEAGFMLGRSLADAVARRAEVEGTRTVVTERRGDAAQLTHGLRDTAIDVRAWPAEAGRPPQNFFQMAVPLEAGDPGPVLAVSGCADLTRFRRGWDQAMIVETVTVAAGPGASRTYSLIRLDGRVGSVVGPDVCPDA